MKAKADAPIGIFDSGFGGLTVARAIVDQLPGEDLIYLGDTARAPYGSRSIAEVRAYTLSCLDTLIDMGVKALVVACNTASSAVLADARERYEVPVCEVIVPAARRAVQISNSGTIAVLCTKTTAKSGVYEDAMAATEAEIVTVVCPRFVEFVEAGITAGEELLQVAQQCLEPVVQSGADTAILGCTHYPLLTGVISYVLGGEIALVSSASECADSTYAMLTKQGLLNSAGFGRKQFLTTGNPDRFAQIGARLLPDLVNSAEVWEVLSPEPVSLNP